MEFQKILKHIGFITLLALTITCSKSDGSPTPTPEDKSKEITIFHINDAHGSIENFAKIKSIIDAEKASTNVIFVGAGDMFSGNPVVDNHVEKGYPMIDLMNRTGIDIAVLGNHEFDYGESVLKDRMLQAQFNWVCANVSMQGTEVMQPSPYETITMNDVKVVFLGLVETNGKEDDIIPSTHPWKVQNFTFQPYQDVIINYESIKEQTNSDIYVALTHLGEFSDRSVAANYPYFDLIIGGHSHTKTNISVSGTPIYHAGSHLNYLGKISMQIKNKEIESINFELIDLNNVTTNDTNLSTLIASYNEDADLDEVIGYANAYHSKVNLGSFYTDALKTVMDADISFQNPGGVRSDLDEGPITKREIFSIDPFNNGSVTYEMSVQDIKIFLEQTATAVYYSGIVIDQEGQSIVIRDENNQVLPDNIVLKLAINDYIPAVYEAYFSSPTQWPFTTAEALIQFLESGDGIIDYSNKNNYFRFSGN